MRFNGQRTSAKNSVVFTGFVIAALFLLGICPVFAMAAASGEGQSEGGLAVRPEGQTPPPVRDGTAMRVSHYEPSQVLRLAFVLTPPHPEEEHQFLEDIQNKKSPLFHKYLSADEWNQRFSPSIEDEQAVVDWATSQGLKVSHRYPNRLVVDVEAAAGTIEKALGVTINNYQIGENVRFANDRDPVFPAQLDAVIQTVAGLNSFENVRPANDMRSTAMPPDYSPGPVIGQGQSLQRDALAETDRTAAGGEARARPEFSSTYGFQPSDLFSSQTYDYGALMNLGHCCNPEKNSGGSPPETSIAIAAFGTVASSDITGFQTTFPTLALNVTTIPIDGTYTCNNSPSADANCVEATLDTEWSLTTSNSQGSYLDTAHVYVYEGANYGNATVIDVYNQILNDSYARVMTTSWDCGENLANGNTDCYNSTMVARDNIFSQLVGQGWTLVNASGDEGATATWCSNSLGVFFPASDPNVVAAGGTYLEPYSDGTFYSETAWTGGTSKGSCSSNNGGGTGGFSNYWSAPTYQTNYFNYTKRATPDFALNAAEAEEIYYNGSLSGVGGTSIVSPELAGFFAQENAYLLSLGSICGTNGTTACWPLGNPNYSIYAAAHFNDVAHYPFYDVTSGCNSNDITALYKLTPYCAGTGFDQVTGWGSANMLQLAWALNWHIATASGRPYVTFSGPAINTWYNTNQTVNFTINDYAGGTTGIPGTGIAGFTQGWDSIPADPTTEPHGGTGNSFYSGPQFPNASTGCLALVGGSCEAILTQGCHTAYVHGWNNQGETTAGQSGYPETYGPVCFDNVAPTATSSVSPSPNGQGWSNAASTVTITATDPGGSGASGVSKIYFGINDQCAPGGPVSNCGIYSAPFKLTQEGVYTIVYYAVDVAGNVNTQNETYVRVMLDETPPVTTAQISGTMSGGVYYSPVNITMQATDNLSGELHTQYQLDGGSIFYYDVGATPPNKIPVTTPGKHTFAYWSTDNAGNVETTKTLTFTIGSAATLTSPTSGTTLAGPSATFSWTTVTGATGYALWLGTTGVGSHDLLEGGVHTQTSLTFSSIPTRGIPVYARLFTSLNGPLVYNDYVFTEATQGAMSSPSPGGSLAGPSTTFTWSAGSGSGYALWLGTSGVGSHDLLEGGVHTGTSLTIASLPTNGEQIYARLFTSFAGTLVYSDYTYTAAAQAVMSSPAASSTLAGPSATFKWSAGSGSGYALWLGTTGAGSHDLLEGGVHTATSLTIATLPTNGVPIYARLFTSFNGTLVATDYTYTAAAQSTMVSPQPGGTLSGSSVTFTWTAGSGQGNALWLGSTGAGSHDLYEGGVHAVTSLTVNGLPTNGEKIYARLWTSFNGTLVSTDYIYTSQ